MECAGVSDNLDAILSVNTGSVGFDNFAFSI
jgi:hypothetical protein